MGNSREMRVMSGQRAPAPSTTQCGRETTAKQACQVDGTRKLTPSMTQQWPVSLSSGWVAPGGLLRPSEWWAGPCNGPCKPAGGSWRCAGGGSRCRILTQGFLLARTDPMKQPLWKAGQRNQQDTQPGVVYNGVSQPKVLNPNPLLAPGTLNSKWGHLASYYAHNSPHCKELSAPNQCLCWETL